MSKVFVFWNQEKMEAFAAENEVPKGVSLDCFGENKQLTRIAEHREEYPNFIFFDGFEKGCRNIFFGMSEDWREGYANDGDGHYIGVVQSEEAISVLRTLRAEAGMSYVYDPYIPRRIWQAPSFSPINVSSLLQMDRESPEPIIDGLLGRGESLLISGPAGIGKSLLVNYLAHVLASGGPLWGYRVPRPAVSLIVQAEVDGFAQRDRLGRLLTDNPELANDRVFMLGAPYDDAKCRVVGKLDDPAFHAEIVRAIRWSGADVLFIDPLISFNPVNENDNTQMRRVLDAFMAALADTGVTVVVTHHTTKGSGKTRGAGAIRDWAANALELELDRVEDGEARIRVIHDKARNFEQADPFYITRTMGLSFELTEHKAARVEDERLQCVVDVLTQAGGRIEGQRTFIEALAKAKDGVQERTARDRIKDARDCGLIVEMEQGYKMPKIYILP